VVVLRLVLQVREQQRNDSNDAQQRRTKESKRTDSMSNSGSELIVHKQSRRALNDANCAPAYGTSRFLSSCGCAYALLARDAPGTMGLRFKFSMATGPSVHRHKWGSQQWPFLIEPVKCDLDSNLGVLFDRNWMIVGSVGPEKQAMMCGQASRAFSYHQHNQ